MFGIPACCDGAEKYKLASDPFAFKISFRHLRYGVQLSFITVGKTGLGAFLPVLGRAVNIVLADFSWAFLGLSGVAIAAGIGYAVPQLVWIVWFYVNRKQVLRIVRPKWRLRTILDSCINGSSEMVSILAFSIGIGYSDGVASLSIIWYAQGLFGRLFRGYINGVSPVVSYHFGRDDKRRLSRLSRISVVTLTVTAAIVTALSYFLVELSFIFAKGSIAVAKSPFMVSESLRPAF